MKTRVMCWHCWLLAGAMACLTVPGCTGTTGPGGSSSSLGAFLAKDEARIEPGTVATLTETSEGWTLTRSAPNPMATFLAIDIEPLDTLGVAAMGNAGFFDGASGFSGRTEFRQDGRTVVYATRSLESLGPFAAMMLAASPDQDDDIQESCTLGANYYDRPGWWDFMRGSSKAETWSAYGDCVDDLLRQVANSSDCFVGMRLEWDADNEYWDHTNWIVCAE